MHLPKGNTELSRDPRPITGVFYGDGDDSGWRVGPRVTKIEAYDECGSMSHVPWIAIFNPDDTIIARIPADKVVVMYV